MAVGRSALTPRLPQTRSIVIFRPDRSPAVALATRAIPARPAAPADCKNPRRDQRQRTIRDHRRAGGSIPRPSGGPDESGGPTYVRCPLQEIPAQRRVVRLILRGCFEYAAPSG